MIGVNCGPNMASLVSGLPLHGSQIRTMRLVALHPEPLPAHGKPLFQGTQIDEPTLALFQRACQNCHSKNTQWPWYSHLVRDRFDV